MPVSRLNRTRTTRAETASLTDRDRELILQATGQRIGIGTNQGWINSLAAAIAADRASGELGPEQEITAFYLEDLCRRYDQAAPYVKPALRYLSQHQA